MDQNAAEFIEHLTNSQLALRAYIRASMGSAAAVDDVVQQTNLVLWRKIDQWQAGTPFLPWMFSVAKFEILAHYRDQQRERLVFDEDVLELMADESQELLIGSLSDRGDALRDCLQHIEGTQRDILIGKYVAGLSIDELAEKFARSHDSIKSGLLRIRKKLNQCISTKLA